MDEMQQKLKEEAMFISALSSLSENPDNNLLNEPNENQESDNKEES